MLFFNFILSYKHRITAHLFSIKNCIYASEVHKSPNGQILGFQHAPNILWHQTISITRRAHREPLKALARHQKSW